MARPEDDPEQEVYLPRDVVEARQRDAAIAAALDELANRADVATAPAQEAVGKGLRATGEALGDLGQSFRRGAGIMARRFGDIGEGFRGAVKDVGEGARSVGEGLKPYARAAAGEVLDQVVPPLAAGLNAVTPIGPVITEGGRIYERAQRYLPQPEPELGMDLRPYEGHDAERGALEDLAQPQDENEAPLDTDEDRMKVRPHRL